MSRQLIYKNKIETIDGYASKAFQLEHSKIVGNKSILLSIQYTVADGAPVALTKIPFNIVSQLDENGNAVTLFQKDANNNLKLISGSLSNITSFEIWDDPIFRRNSGTAGTPDVTNSQVLSALYINTTNNTTIKTTPITHHIFDNINITGAQIYEPKRYYNVMIEKELPNGLTPEIGLAWSNTLYGAQELQLKSLEVTILIKYYDPNSNGGN